MDLKSLIDNYDKCNTNISDRVGSEVFRSEKKLPINLDYIEYKSLDDNYGKSSYNISNQISSEKLKTEDLKDFK